MSLPECTTLQHIHAYTHTSEGHRPTHSILVHPPPPDRQPEHIPRTLRATRLLDGRPRLPDRLRLPTRLAGRGRLARGDAAGEELLHLDEARVALALGEGRGGARARARRAGGRAEALVVEELQGEVVQPLPRGVSWVCSSVCVRDLVP